MPLFKNFHLQTANLYVFLVQHLLVRLVAPKACDGLKMCLIVQHDSCMKTRSCSKVLTDNDFIFLVLSPQKSSSSEDW